MHWIAFAWFYIALVYKLWLYYATTGLMLYSTLYSLPRCLHLTLNIPDMSQWRSMNPIANTGEGVESIEPTTDADKGSKGMTTLVK
jgi:hypothetical protein